VNLDAHPVDRWTQVCSMPNIQANSQFLYNFVTQLLPDGGANIEEIGELLNNYYLPKEYAEEVVGCSKVLGVPYGWLTLFQIGYELSDACTSIISQSSNGVMYHSRNLDFWAGYGFTQSLKNSTIQVSFQSQGKTIFQATTFGGMVGVLSGFKSKLFSITEDTRFYPEGIKELFYEIIAAIEEKNASLVSFLTRDALMKATSFDEALNMLSNSELIADVYYIIAGTKAGQGAVISRNRTDAADVWMIDAPHGRWFEVETNYDHWKQPPWFDDRRTPAIANMKTLGSANLNPKNLFGIMGMKPTLNLQTTYSIVACPATGYYESYVRNCEYPCVQ